MTQEKGRVFPNASELKAFTPSKHRRIESWLAANFNRAGMKGSIHKDTVAAALRGQPVEPATVDALELLLSEIRADPWEWCKPPTSVDALTEYETLKWWHETLNPPVLWSRFERMNKFPLDGDDLELTEICLHRWSSRLRAACDQFKADRALAAAITADMKPEFQYWVQDGDRWRMLDHEAERKRTEGAIQRRVGNPGLHGRTPEEIGLAYALVDAMMPLPDLKEARLLYARPRVVPVHDHFSTPVEPWNGDAFDGFEPDVTEMETGFDEDKAVRITATFDVEHDVRFYWSEDRYLRDYVKMFARIKERHVDQDWRAPTRDERDLLEIKMVRKFLTVEEMQATRAEWVAQLWAQCKDVWARPDREQFSTGSGRWFKIADYPDGVPVSLIEAAFDAEVAALALNEEARDEYQEVARRRMQFRRQLRSRAG